MEPWCWTELVAFDNRAPDCGAAEYLDTLGFVPHTLCLLFSSPDFALQHPGMATEYVLPPEVCSRSAHPGNEVRQRQKWTNYQLRKLVAELRKAGAEVYFSQFTNYYRDRFHHEWLTDHPEVRQVWSFHHRGMSCNPLGKLADGTLFEDIYIPKVVTICRDYGFSGWHGPDGWGPLSSGNAMGTDFSDPIMEQFLKGRDWELPECLKNPCPAIVFQEEREAARSRGEKEPETGLAQLQERGRWIWENHRREYLEFLAERWCRFWGKMIRALHEAGLKGAVNSAWTKGNFDAFYEYGIHYRKMSELGIDHMIVETVALGMSQSCPDQEWFHDDYAASLMEIKAFAPHFKLLILHGIKDVVENWDNLRHAAPGYERELYRLSDHYFRTRRGLVRSADGLLACLADGIAPHEWEFIRKRWQCSFDGTPYDAGEVTMIWDDAQLSRGVDDFMLDGFLPGQKQVAALLRHGVPIQTACRLEDASCCKGVILVPNAHLLAPDALNALVAASPGPVALTGRYACLERFFAAGETVTDGRMCLTVLHGGEAGAVKRFPTPQIPYVPTVGELYFSTDRNRQVVAPEVWTAGAALLQRVAAEDFRKRGVPFARVAGAGCTLLTRRMDERTLDVALENRLPWGRIKRTVTMSHPIERLEVLSSFPLRESARPDDRSFTVPIAPRGIAVVRVHIKP